MLSSKGHEWWSVLALLFALHLVLTWRDLTPNLEDIQHDEATYIDMGREVRLYNLPAVDGSPLTALFFALTDAPVHESDFWLIHSGTIGRFVLFVLLWVSSYLVAKRISEISSPLIIIGFLLLSPAVSSLVRNGTHALFTVMSSFALAYIILFQRTKELTNLWMTSVFVSLALLSRMGEGTFLLVVFITFSTLLGISIRRVRATVAAATIPIVILVGGYMLVYYSLIGKSPLGTGEYFYSTFEQGHGLAYQDKFPRLDFWTEGEAEAGRLFGTAERNQHSVLAAIERNPTAYLDRVPRLAKVAVWTTISVYGGPLSLWLFLLALQGCIELLRKKQFMFLSILLFWPSYLLIYILLVFQPTHFLLPYPVVFCLASIGLTSVVSLPDKQRYLWSAILVGLITLAISRDTSLPFVSSAVVLLIGLWIVWIVLNRFRNIEIVTYSAFVFLFSMMLLFRGGISLQKARKLGIAPDEQAMLFLRRNFVEHTPVAAYTTKVVRAAGMKHVSLNKSSFEAWSEQDLQRWMIDHDVQAIYLDHRLTRNDPYLSALIENQVGKSLEIAFSSDDPDVRILRHLRSSKVVSGLPISSGLGHY